MNLAADSVVLTGPCPGGMGPAQWHYARVNGVEALAKSYPLPLDPAHAALWLQSELSAAQAVAHPAVQKPLGLWQGPDGTAFLLLHRPAGRRWDEIVRIGQQRHSYLAARAWDDATRLVFVTAAETLLTGHKAGLAHGNLAADSLWVALTPAGDLQVTLGDYCRLTPLIPGPRIRFCAPEQLSGGAADPRTDVFRLGLLLYFTLTGTTPWPEEDLTSARAARQVPIDQLPDDRCRAAWQLLQRWPEVAEALRLSLQFDPARRLPGVRELLAKLGLYTQVAGPPPQRKVDLGYAIAATAALLTTLLVSLPPEDSRVTRLMLDRQPLAACSQQLPVLAGQVCSRYGSAHANCTAAMAFLLSREECPNRVKQLRSCLNQP